MFYVITMSLIKGMKSMQWSKLRSQLSDDMKNTFKNQHLALVDETFSVK